uniref:Uncharacterized protein n=2 Tax=Panagrolaimus sp. PS1159 TaxID=55785 RepID=A0AC35GKL1_9BILA
MSDSRIVFKKPSDDIDSVTTTILEERDDAGTSVDGASSSSIAVFNPYYTMSIQKQRSMLPISKYKMQPRRVAAVTLATRVADEQLCRLGSKVGFVVRFGGVTSDETMIQ